jgi:hypothetical protein
MARASLAVLAAAFLLTGCAATRRAAENAAAVVTFPFHVVATPVAFLAEDFDRDPLSTATTLPFFFPLYVAGDVFWTGVSAADLALAPLYAGDRPGGPGIYDFSTFPPVLERRAALGLGRSAAGTAQVVAPLGLMYLDYRGKADGTFRCDPPPAIEIRR